MQIMAIRYNTRGAGMNPGPVGTHPHSVYRVTSNGREYNVTQPGFAQSFEVRYNGNLVADVHSLESALAAIRVHSGESLSISFGESISPVPSPDETFDSMVNAFLSDMRTAGLSYTGGAVAKAAAVRMVERILHRKRNV